jgi:hypothetical protein
MSIIRQLQQAVPEELPRSSSEEGPSLPAGELSQGEQRKPLMSESLHICVEQLRNVLLLEDLGEAKRGLETLMQEFAENDR